MRKASPEINMRKVQPSMRRSGGSGRQITEPVVDRGLQLAIKAAGGYSELAESLGIRPQSVWQWTRVPLNRVVEVEKVTGVPRRKLRPELYQ